METLLSFTIESRVSYSRGEEPFAADKSDLFGVPPDNHCNTSCPRLVVTFTRNMDEKIRDFDTTVWKREREKSSCLSAPRLSPPKLPSCNAILLETGDVLRTELTLTMSYGESAAGLMTRPHDGCRCGASRFLGGKTMRTVAASLPWSPAAPGPPSPLNSRFRKRRPRSAEATFSMC